MSTVVVLGAGPIGAAAAFQLACRDTVRRVVLVDPTATVAQGLALDMQQAAAVTGSSTRLIGTSDIATVIDAVVIVVADRHGDAGEWTGDEALSLVSAAYGLNRLALVVCAGATHAGLIERLVLERGLDRRRVVGAAPEALRRGLQTLTALAADVAARDVSLMVLGRPPRHLFVAWSGASVAGSPATEVLRPPVVARLDQQGERLWPPGPFALGAATAVAAGHYVTNAPGVVSLLMVPPDDQEKHRRCVSLPATMGSAGAAPRWPRLAPRDQVRLESAWRT